MKSFTLNDIRSWDPDDDLTEYLPENWSGTVMDLLKMEEIPFSDVLWVVCKSKTISEKTQRLFAVWCARQVQHLMRDPRSIAAVDVAEKFANGQASGAELDAARDAARDAAWDAARDAARAVAWDAARAASAASAVAWDAARDAAWGAQRDKLMEMIEAEG